MRVLVTYPPKGNESPSKHWSRCEFQEGWQVTVCWIILSIARSKSWLETIISSTTSTKSRLSFFSRNLLVPSPWPTSSRSYIYIYIYTYTCSEIFLGEPKSNNLRGLADLEKNDDGPNFEWSHICFWPKDVVKKGILGRHQLSKCRMHVS